MTIDQVRLSKLSKGVGYPGGFSPGYIFAQSAAQNPQLLLNIIHWLDGKL
jgi:hypothetical protein